MRHLPVSIQWTYPRGGGKGARATLRITDERSSMTVLEVTLEAEEVVDLLSSTNVTGLASFPDEAIVTRLGKTMEHARIPHPENVTLAARGGTPSAQMEEFAAAQVASGEWEVASWTKHNFGWALTGRRWVD
jgi:hypothetical protein